MFTQKPYAAFGYALIKNTYSDGFIIKTIINSESIVSLFCTKGSALEQSEQPLNLFPGTFITPDQHIIGSHEHTTIGETHIWCFDPIINRNFTPTMRKFYLPQNSNQILPQGTKLFFCEGIALINEKEINKPTQLLIRTGDTQITATVDCYGLIFE